MHAPATTINDEVTILRQRVDLLERQLATLRHETRPHEKDWRKMIGVLAGSAALAAEAAEAGRNYRDMIDQPKDAGVEE